MARNFGRSETRAKARFVKDFGSWCARFEAGFGGDNGAPDLATIVDGEVVFLELKVGAIEGDKLFVSDIRPSQISWHRGFLIGGGALCFFLVGVPVVDRKNSDRWDFYLLPLQIENYIREMKHGFELKQVLHWPFKFQSEKVRCGHLQEWHKQCYGKRIESTV